MQQTTQRYHTWLSPEEYHNGRDEDTITRENKAAEQGRKDRWIDPKGQHEVFGPGESVLEAFGTVFGESIADYNAHQKRADRKMSVEGYMQSVENDRRGRPVKSIKIANAKARAEGREERKESGPRTHYEVVWSLGNVKPLRGDDGKIVIDPQTGLRVRPNYVPADIIRAITEEYLEKWDERNPNLYLRRADFHADEWYKVTKGGISQPGLPGQWLQGQAHTHFDFIPWAEGYQRGPKRQLSITKAFAAMGFADKVGQDGRTVTAWEQWQNREQEVIKEIALKHGYEIVPAHDSRDALAADEYAELAEAREAVEDAKAELAEVKARTAGLEEQEAAMVSWEQQLDAREDGLDRRERVLDARDEAQDAREQEQEAQRERLAKAAAEFNRQKEEAHDLEERLPSLKRQAQDEQEKARKAAQASQEAIESARGWNRTIEGQQAQVAALQAQIEALTDERSEAYKAVYAKGYAAGQKSPTGQVNAALEAERQEELTDEQRRQNAKRDGVGLV